MPTLMEAPRPSAWRIGMTAPVFCPLAGAVSYSDTGREIDREKVAGTRNIRLLAESVHSFRFLPPKSPAGRKTRGWRPQLSVEIAGAFSFRSQPGKSNRHRRVC